MSFVDLTQDDYALSSPPSARLATQTTTASGSGKKQRKDRKLLDDAAAQESDDSFLFESIEGIGDPFPTTTTSLSAPPPPVVSSSTSSSSTSTSSSKRKRKGKERDPKEKEDEEEETRASTTTLPSRKEKASSGKATKDKAASKKPQKKKKKTAPEDDVMVLIDSNLINEKGGDEYISVCQKPDRDKKPVLYDVRALPIRNSIEWRTSFGVEDDEDDCSEEEEEGLIFSSRDDELREKRKQRKRNVVDHVLVKYSGAEFGRLVRERGLKEEVGRIKAAHPAKRITVLVEGLHSFFAQETRRVNRALKGGAQAEERDSSEDSDSDSDEDRSDRAAGKSNGAARRVTRSMVDEAFVWLQIEGKCHVRKSDSVQESAGYVYRLTSAIANAPYRQESSFSTFCAEATGKKPVRNSNITEIWIKQLQQINKVSVSIASAIAKEYPTFRSLMSVYQSDALTNQQKELLLQDVKIEAVVGSKDRRVGPAMSKKIYQVFTEGDGTKTVN